MEVRGEMLEGASRSCDNPPVTVALVALAGVLRTPRRLPSFLAESPPVQASSRVSEPRTVSHLVGARELIAITGIWPSTYGPCGGIPRRLGSKSRRHGSRTPGSGNDDSR
jgi:hypothetical protein